MINSSRVVAAAASGQPHSVIEATSQLKKEENPKVETNRDTESNARQESESTVVRASKNSSVTMSNSALDDSVSVSVLSVEVANPADKMTNLVAEPKLIKNCLGTSSSSMKLADLMKKQLPI